MNVNLGLAIEDVATGTLIYARALEAGVGVELASWGCGRAGLHRIFALPPQRRTAVSL